MRLSDADIIVPEVSDSLNPSFAIKFLRDGVWSANQFGMVAFEPQGTWNFWENDFQSHLPEHDGTCGPQSFAKFNAAAFTTIFQTGSVDMANYEQDGTAVETAKFPYYIRFKPNTDLPATVFSSTTTWFEQLQGDKIPAGTKLFDVLGLADMPTCSGRDCEPVNPCDHTDEELTKIGEIHSRTEFTQSLWGDEGLYFRHGKFNDDTDSIYGGTVGGTSTFRSRWLLKFDEDEWGEYPVDSFVPPETNQDEIVSGMENFGCPFQWIIDSLE